MSGKVAEMRLKRRIGRERSRVLSSRSVAYVILTTSGSTGKPKGTVIRHSSAVTLVEWAGEEYGEEEWAVVAGTSMCFDLSVYEICAAELGRRGDRGGERAGVGVAGGEGGGEADQHGAVCDEGVGADGGARMRTWKGDAEPESVEVEIYGKTEVKRVVNLYGPTERHDVFGRTRR